MYVLNYYCVSYFHNNQSQLIKRFYIEFLNNNAFKYAHKLNEFRCLHGKRTTRYIPIYLYIPSHVKDHLYEHGPNTNINNLEILQMKNFFRNPHMNQL